MQKKMIAVAATLACATALPVMAQSAAASKVQLWGVVDAAVRHVDKQGADGSSKTEMIGGGMSQSRWGIKVEEDLGGGTKALVELENRFTTDDGASPVGNTPFFQLAFVGLQGNFGRLTMGRQWNVLFDVVTSTYASFPYSPYMDAFKPELGMAVGARNSNMLKYAFANADRSFAGALQYSFDEGANADALANGAQAAATSAVTAAIPGYLATAPAGTTPQAAAAALAPTVGALAGRNYLLSNAGALTALGGSLKTYGGFLRYAKNGIAFGGGYLRTELPGDSKVDAWTVGGSYRNGPLYVNLGYGLNKLKAVSSTNAFVAGIDRQILGSMWSGQTNGGFQPGDANKRDMVKIGFGYQITPQLNAGLHYFHAKQSGSASGNSNGKAHFAIAAVDYAFSKRTDAYFAVDHIKLSSSTGSNLTIEANNPANKRTGITAGIRHRF